MSRHWLLWWLGALVVLASAGCSQTAPSPAPGGFSLPEGDPEAGKTAFLRMRCFDCHLIPGMALPVAEEPNQVLVTLGGEVSKVATYDDLVTSIINPSHRLAKNYTPMLVSRDGESNMTNYNQTMTVADLINLVAFLQPKYQVKKPAPTEYQVYYP